MYGRSKTWWAVYLHIWKSRNSRYLPTYLSESRSWETYTIGTGLKTLQSNFEIDGKHKFKYQVPNIVEILWCLEYDIEKEISVSNCTDLFIKIRVFYDDYSASVFNLPECGKKLIPKTQGLVVSVYSSKPGNEAGPPTPRSFLLFMMCIRGTGNLWTVTEVCNNLRRDLIWRTDFTLPLQKCS